MHGDRAGGPQANMACAEQKDLASLCKRRMTKGVEMGFAELADDAVVYAYAVRVSSLPGDILAIAQRDCDRTDADQPCPRSRRFTGQAHRSASYWVRLSHS